MTSKRTKETKRMRGERGGRKQAEKQSLSAAPEFHVSKVLNVATERAPSFLSTHHLLSWFPYVVLIAFSP